MVGEFRRILKPGLVIFFIVMSLSVMLTGLKKWRSTQAIDYFQFWVVGQAVDQMNISDIYTYQDKKDIKKFFQKKAKLTGSNHQRYCVNFRSTLELAGSPFLYAVFKFVSTGHYDYDYAIYRHIGLLSFYISLVLLVIGLRMPMWSLLGGLILFTYYYFPFKFDVKVGNVNQLQLAFLILFIILLRKDNFLMNALSGVSIGLLIMFKPSLLPCLFLLVVYWVFHDDFARLWQVGISFVVTALVCFFVSESYLHQKALWGNWSSEFQNIIFVHTYMKKSLLSFLFSVENRQILTGFNVCFTLGCAAAIALNCIREKRFRLGLRADQFGTNRWLAEFMVLNIGILSTLIGGALVHGHYFLLAIPAAYLTFSFRTSGKPALAIFRDPTLWIWMLSMFFLANQPYFRSQGWVQHPHQSLWTYGGALLLLVLSFVDLFSYSRRDQLAQRISASRNLIL